MSFYKKKTPFLEKIETPVMLTPCGRENFIMKFRIWIMYWSKMYDVCYVQFYLSKYPINANAYLSNSHLSQLLP